MQNEHNSMHLLVRTQHRVAVVTQHGVEEGPGRHDGVHVDDGVFLEEDLEDRDHHDDVADGQSDESHRLYDHFQKCHNQD